MPDLDESVCRWFINRGGGRCESTCLACLDWENLQSARGFGRVVSVSRRSERQESGRPSGQSGASNPPKWPGGAGCRPKRCLVARVAKAMGSALSWAQTGKASSRPAASAVWSQDGA